MHLGDRLVVDLGAREVGRDVDHHWARAAAAGDVESLVEHLRDLERAADHPRVLDGGHGDAERVRLLEAICAEQIGADLTGDEHHRHRVHHRVHDRRDEVGRPRATRAQSDTDLAGRLRVTGSRMATACLVPDKDVANARVHERVVGREIRATGVTEYDLDTLRLKALHHGINCSHCARPPSLSKVDYK